jgi:hypothetical protein
MKLFGLFVEHELMTQWRSMRFRGLALLYVIVAAIPPVVLFAISGRMPRLAGPAAYNTFLLSEQPLLTALLAAGLALDAISRERDEGSFSVLSVAPVSSIGYVLRRWLAVVAICILVSLLPTIITAAIGAHTRYTFPAMPIFFEGWLMSVLPALLVSSALAIAVGTITGRTVLAIIFGVLLITAGIGIADDLLFYIRINFDGPGELFAGGTRHIQELIWTMKGYWLPNVPSDAAFALRNEFRALLSRAGVTAAMSIVLLAASGFYLRRTRRDLRPWKIAETHQIRTMLRTFNRIREEYAPDSGSSSFDRAVLVIAVVLAVLLVGSIVHKQSAFAALAAERYAGETSQAASTSTSVVADSVRIDGAIATSGTLRDRVSMILRNVGDRGETHLSFALNPTVAVRRVAIDRGVVRTRRVWERLDVDLDPPLMPRQSRTLSFDLDGMPAEIAFALQRSGDFRAQWNHYLTAKEAIYLTDLSRSTISPAATEVRMHLRGSDLAPVLRYTPWVLDEQGEGFRPETITPLAALDVRLTHPYAVAADSCGTISAREVVSRCSTGLATYVVVGGPFVQRPIGRTGGTLAYIPAHEFVAEAQAQSLAAAIAMAGEAWPGLALPPHLLFVERPSEAEERHMYAFYESWRSVKEAGSRGQLFFVPESVFVFTKAFSPNLLAASIVAGTLRARRPVAFDQSAFFDGFYHAVALARMGMRKATAVEAGVGFPPDTTPLLIDQRQSRMAKVLASIEYRAGADHFVEGITDFVNAGERPGTARELLNDIGRRAGIDLSRAYDDYVAGRALPQLTLADVAFHRSGERWEVSGMVKNTATGEAFVPVALRTSHGSLWQTIRVDSGGSTPFAFSTDGEPHSVQLDPDHVCYRHAVIGLIENVENRGPS